MRIISFNYRLERLDNQIFFQESEKFFFKFEKFFSEDNNEIRYLVFINLIDKEYFLEFTLNEIEKELLISNYYFFLNESNNKIFDINETIEIIKKKLKLRNLGEMENE